jgi:hypothetical protein
MAERNHAPDRFPSLGTWARDRRGLPSIADGRAGWAWVYLHGLRAGVVDEDPGIRRALRRSLQRKLTRRPFPFPSHLIGNGAPVVIAALAARRHAEFADLLPPLASHWLTSAALARETDVMSGTAGALLAAAEVHKHAPDLLPEDFIGDLVASVTKQLSAMLTQSRTAPVPLGMAHGFAGLCLALSEAEQTWGHRFRRRSAAVALLHGAGVRGEDGAIRWPIVSAPKARGDGTQRFPNAWCHGAPGIGLALLALHRASPVPETAALVAGALKAAADEEPDSSRTFCCGTIGRAQFLIEGHRVTRDPLLLEQARRYAARVRKTTWPASSQSFHGGVLGARYLEWRLRAPHALPLPGLGSGSAATDEP